MTEAVNQTEFPIQVNNKAGHPETKKWTTEKEKYNIHQTTLEQVEKEKYKIHQTTLEQVEIGDIITHSRCLPQGLILAE
jgi:ribosomal protein S17